MALLCLLGRPIQMNEDIHQPHPLPLGCFPVEFEGRHDSQVGAGAISKGSIAGSIVLSTLA
jgi:hypothetical protein